MAPWSADGERLLRPLITPHGRPVAVVANNAGSTEQPAIHVDIESLEPLDATAVNWVIATLTSSLALDDDVTEFYDNVVPNDPILDAASTYGLRGARLKTSPTVFEAVVAALASQNVHFSRTYLVMDRLVRTFGIPVHAGDTTIYTFPDPATIAKADDYALRACGLGYRSRLLSGLANQILEHDIDLDALRSDPDTNRVRTALIDLFGIGPFTADLVLSIGFRRPAFHLDSFTRAILTTFYDQPDDDDRLAAFVETRFGSWKHYAMLLLTTDTHLWARGLGIDFPIRSEANYRLPTEMA